MNRTLVYNDATYGDRVTYEVDSDGHVIERNLTPEEVSALLARRAVLWDQLATAFDQPAYRPPYVQYSMELIA